MNRNWILSIAVVWVIGSGLAGCAGPASLVETGEALAVATTASNSETLVTAPPSADNSETAVALVETETAGESEVAPQKQDAANDPAAAQERPEADFMDGLLNLTFELDGETITLLDGMSEVEAAPGSASKVITRYFGNAAVGDVNGDGLDDVSFLITQDGGGSGTFFYVVAALQTEEGLQGTNAVFLGDRIAPQTSAIENGAIIVNYANRKPDENFTVQPSVGVSKVLQVTDGSLVEVSGVS